MKQHLIVEVFRSSKHDGMYLYVEKKVGLKDIPEDLMTRFGKGVSAMTMLLTSKSKLARTTPEKVTEAIREKGFYLQMPPAKDDYLLDLYKTPTESVY